MFCFALMKIVVTCERYEKCKCLSVTCFISARGNFNSQVENV
uniref:Uncharacterized protein n=1 Tax=Anguilla anguilla TaxID=7936 RepID=A0A0E9VPV1_ANGAN